MNELDLSNYYEREEAEEQKVAQEATAQQAQMEAQEEPATAPAEPAAQTEDKPKDGPDFLGDLESYMTDELGVQNPAEGGSINDMGGKARSVAGVVDTVMDLTSKFIPAMQKPADWWDEQSGRKTETDPLKKAERDAAAVIMPMLLTGGLVGGATKAAGLTGKTKLMTDAVANLGIDAIISGTSDTTSEAGNLSSLVEDQLQKILPNATIPLASRDSDSPDTIYDKNFIESMLLGGLDPISLVSLHSKLVTRLLLRMR